jgi:hypothetical protein
MRDTGKTGIAQRLLSLQHNPRGLQLGRVGIPVVKLAAIARVVSDGTAKKLLDAMYQRSGEEMRGEERKREGDDDEEERRRWVACKAGWVSISISIPIETEAEKGTAERRLTEEQSRVRSPSPIFVRKTEQTTRKHKKKKKKKGRRVIK